jgi:hypothetical protein
MWLKQRLADHAQLSWSQNAQLIGKFHARGVSIPDYPELAYQSIPNQFREAAGIGELFCA